MDKAAARLMEASAGCAVALAQQQQQRSSAGRRPACAAACGGGFGTAAAALQLLAFFRDVAGRGGLPRCASRRRSLACPCLTETFVACACSPTRMGYDTKKLYLSICIFLLACYGAAAVYLYFVLGT